MTRAARSMIDMQTVASRPDDALGAKDGETPVYSEDKQILDVLCHAEEDLAGTCKIEKMEVNVS